MGIKYLLDTNILSELSRQKPNEQVVQKIHQYDGQCATAALVIHEMSFGIERLPEGKLKDNLKIFLQQLENFEFQVFSYDKAAAQYHASERARLTAKGLTPSFVDGQIAAIAATNDLVLVTRNVRDFEHFSGLAIENWFS